MTYPLTSMLEDEGEQEKLVHEIDLDNRQTWPNRQKDEETPAIPRPPIEKSLTDIANELHKLVSEAVLIRKALEKIARK